jgi:uncharacterized protein YbaP (TraB family)
VKIRQAIRRYLAPVLGALAIGVAGFGALSPAQAGPEQPGPAKAMAHAKAMAQAKPAPVRVFAWKVRPAGAASNAEPDYLVGTAHFSLPGNAAFSAAFGKALGNCDRFYMEADLDSVTPEIVAKYIMLSPGEKTLDKALPAKAWRKIQETLRPLGLGPEQLKIFDPWYLSMLLALPEADKERMLDSVLRKEAEARKVQVGFLESADSVLAAMDGIDPKEDMAMLLETVDDLPRAKREVAAISANYQRGNLAAIEKLLFEADRVEKYPDYFDRLLFKRNAAWLPAIEGAFKNSDAMVAVGLGHLVGKKGLVADLKAKGYKIEALRL